ncbi:hypothetical protein KKG83_04115 [Candidatus Micrarchaeota archaeon]|nr:hypothetical protein [Candidatus Micrarchaeota archaeon]
MVQEKEASIIETITKMVREGKSEKKIVSELKTLGITEEQAKKLLLLAEADTFDLLKMEIKKIVRQDLAAEEPWIKKFIQIETEIESKKISQDLLREMSNDLDAYKQKRDKETESFKDMVLSKINIFQTKVNSNIMALTGVISKLKDSTVKIDEKVDMAQLDLTELRLKGTAKKLQLLRFTLIGSGVIFGFLAFYFAFVNISGGLSDLGTVSIFFGMIIVALALLFMASKT